MVDWGLVAVAAPTWGLGAYGVLALVGKAPVRLRRWDRERVEDEHAKYERERQLNMLAAKTDLILAAISPNGGASLFDKVARIEVKLDDHIDASDKVEARVYEDIAEVGREVDALQRRIVVVERSGLPQHADREEQTAPGKMSEGAQP